MKKRQLSVITQQPAPMIIKGNTWERLIGKPKPIPNSKRLAPSFANRPRPVSG